MSRNLLSKLLPARSCRNVLDISKRGFTTGQRDFWQRINEQHLAHELEQMGKSGHSSSSDGAAGVKLFDPKIRLRQNRRVVPSDPQEGRTSKNSSDAAGFEATKKRKPWLNYESLRGETYPDSGDSTSSKGPRFQDLTHNEAQRLQEMYMRKRMLDRKIMWMKMQDLPNPQKEAKMTLRRAKKEEEAKKAEAEAKSIGGQMYPPPFMDQHPGSRFMVREEEKARQEELESRFRSRIRQEKLANSRLMHAAPPKVGDVVTDPIQRHVDRRLVRQRVKIHMGLEEILTRNTAQILFEFLRGVAISIVKVRAKTPRSTQEIHYSLTSDHDPAWVQKQLDVIAPKLRSQLALKVNMGQTPNIRFVPKVKTEEIKREHLWGYARALKDQIPVGGGWGSDMGAVAGSRTKP